ncbi:hypothetical protein ACI2KR_16900 [Pseudomonas luteola]
MKKDLAKISPAHLRQNLRKHTPMARLISFEDWIKQNTPLMLELGLYNKMEALNSEAAQIREWLEESNGFALDKDMEIMAAWRGKQLEIENYAKSIQKSRTQKENARKPRDDQEVTEVIRHLAKSTSPAKELWAKFIDELDNLSRHPKESSSAQGRLMVTFEDHKDRKKSFSLKRFENLISNLRNPKDPASHG